MVCLNFEQGVSQLMVILGFRFYLIRNSIHGLIWWKLNFALVLAYTTFKEMYGFETGMILKISSSLAFWTEADVDRRDWERCTCFFQLLVTLSCALKWSVWILIVVFLNFRCCYIFASMLYLFVNFMLVFVHFVSTYFSYVDI